MKPFRFTWNHETLSKEDTYMILTTLLIATLSLVGVLVFMIL